MKRWIIGLAVLLLAVVSLACYSNHKKTEKLKQQQCVAAIEEAEKQNAELRAKRAVYERTKVKADLAFAFCKSNKLNAEYCYLVDFSIPSGKHRFFIWNFDKDTIVSSSLCAHGYGKGSTQSTPVFSNVEGSYCSSLGRYKTGVRSYSNYGIHVHYKLHGLDKTNSNAFKRWVVLHAHTPIPDEEIYPRHLPLGYSQGCPVISNAVMKEIDDMLKKTDKPVLLWIYN